MDIYIYDYGIDTMIIIIIIYLYISIVISLTQTNVLLYDLYTPEKNTTTQTSWDLQCSPCWAHCFSSLFVQATGQTQCFPPWFGSWQAFDRISFTACLFCFLQLVWTCLSNQIQTTVNLFYDVFFFMCVWVFWAAESRNQYHLVN